jgi:hypothetical protein
MRNATLLSDASIIGWRYADPNEMIQHYNPELLSDGWNRLPDGEEIFYVPRPAVASGLPIVCNHSKK